MSRPQLQKLMIGALCYFVRAGDTVDSVVVTEAAKPDNNPTTNWGKLGECTGVTFDKDVKVNTFTEIDNNGRPRRRTETVVLADYIDIRLDNTLDIVNELIFGLSPITLGTAQIPFAKMDRLVTGWLKVEAKNSNTGANFTLFDLWCEIRMKSNATAMNAAEPVRPELRVQSLGADLDTILFPTVS